MKARATSCANGVFLGVSRQPELALKHVSVKELAEDAGPFARLSLWGFENCTVDFALACNNDAVELRQTKKCEDLPPEPAVQSPIGQQWEVCAQYGSGSRLTLRESLIDSTFDIPTAPEPEISGCIQVFPADSYPHLDTVRGSVDEQRAALVQVKKDVGGCPLWRTNEDIVDRGNDFAVGGFLTRVQAFGVRLHFHFAQEEAAIWATGTGPPLGRINLKQLMALILVLGTGGTSAMVGVQSYAYCGEPGLALLPMRAIAVTRHPQVAVRVADQHQRRMHILGGGNSEICFDPTLPIFMSTGSEEHTQSRLLWDRVGMDRMHLEDLPPIGEANVSWKRALTDKLGMPPSPGEIALKVAPLFMERLWRKRPTPEQAEIFASYMSYGAPCIMSNILQHVPIWPGLVQHIRATVLEFARDSPVGKAIEEELAKPEFNTLRAIYAKAHAQNKPKSVVDRAIQNLGDASMFAGLVGTTGMTLTCITQQRMYPEHVRLFRQNASSYLWELMRVAPVVGGAQSALAEHLSLRLAGFNMTLKPGTPIFGSSSASGMDPSVFENPTRFDPTRSNLGEMMTWNGKLKHVIARNYSGAPRFCPGQLLSVKIAETVCRHFTQDLQEPPLKMGLL